ncbi:unnamed protein product [Musa acuminata subsp. malaccensis]|uniref:(wild Malaysian banana) hypothetical protein n=1 Tax=Musa acuminata subsp. malaccensis TaxID=214687 RepID=A0A8D7FEK1_MUSAM|nr:unnamed protein product [Musa acuminata subsp. malaccensis]
MNHFLSWCFCFINISSLISIFCSILLFSVLVDRYILGYSCTQVNDFCQNWFWEDIAGVSELVSNSTVLYLNIFQVGPLWCWPGGLCLSIKIVKKTRGIFIGTNTTSLKNFNLIRILLTNLNTIKTPKSTNTKSCIQWLLYHGTI